LVNRKHDGLHVVVNTPPTCPCAGHRRAPLSKAGYPCSGRTTSPEAPLNRPINDFIGAWVLTPLLAHLPVALRAQLIDFGEHAGQQPLSRNSAYPCSLKVPNLPPLPLDLAALVTCPVALYPATSDSEKISFNQINRKTGHRIKYAKVDADTGEEVSNDDIMKGYKVDTDTYIEVSKDELENIALESTRTIDIDEFVPKSDIDPRYLIRPYYLVPDGKVGHDAFAVIRETIRSMDKVAIGRVVLTNREHIIALEPLEKGLMGTLLRYPYEVRDEKEYFDDIQDVKVTKDMLDLAKHMVTQKAGDFEPEKFEDHYEAALTELINAKRNGKTIGPRPRPRGDNVVDLMDALKKSIAGETSAKGKKPRKASAGQKEMLLPIEGKKPAAKKAAKPDRTTRRKAG
jgi:DNA end-binding protein Ku